MSRSLRGCKRTTHDRRGNTYETKSIRIRMCPDVFCQVAVGHPFRNQLERGGRDTEERDDVSVVQVFPYDGLLVERLWLSSAVVANR